MVYWKLLISGAVRSKLGNFSRMYNVLEIADSARAVPGQKKKSERSEYVNNTNGLHSVQKSENAVQR